mmetsp:Transcript_38500/g.81666  ORF Transcript_38500/g.81666 Transcript_38500/m.81666 type:complete len:257 (+) Transcript_38500:203-973(+)|eukprot:CAMPEP_0206453750 /NCGR_PEP_ID=MMETSP0324_2-20121206/20733_1 /ASSEMBLY_ACC=CAM_ASM_000836 /TAXON_ID=2866 /ORGANISM="Crypthecodinium cohnii, Strain Seligo" /LENGTH=256 /DNA_ID=CAMNT_0053924103 /DNA_START=243 /DNA_END=1013 /DNA_ORIENTATION=+
MCLGAPLPQGAGLIAPVKPLANVPVLGFDLLDLQKPFVQDFSVKAVEAAEKAPVVPPAGVSHTDVDDQLLGKTKLCKFFTRGFCSKGRQCTFAHGRKELKPVPNLYKTEMCFEFASRGRCMRGNACKYAHLEEELRAPIVQAPAARSAKARRGSNEKVLSQKLEAMEREAEQLRAQLKALAVITTTKTQSSTASSCSFEDISSSETPRSSSCDSLWMDEDDTEVESRLEVTRTSINLVPVARATQRRSQSVPRSMH